jgi:uncharacterized membrane protein
MWFRRDQSEFGRVVNLSDAVFAIAMTLLVFTLDLGQTLGEPGTFVREQTSNILVFILAFALVANVWWQHHKLYAMLGSIETGMIVINLALLGAVALVPYPTNLVGNFPTSAAAVITFICLFVILNLFYMLFVIRAQQVNAWDPPLPVRFYYWLVFQPITGILVLGVAALITLWRPVFGLGVLAVSIVFGPFAARLSYREDSA